MLQASGREIDARADEYFAVFERAAAAIEAAVAIQRALGKRAWPDGLDVQVRVGIHSGRPTLTDVGYIGLAVHTTARVCSAAHGGQIVVSANTRAAVRDIGAGQASASAALAGIACPAYRTPRRSFRSRRRASAPRFRSRGSGAARPREPPPGPVAPSAVTAGRAVVPASRIGSIEEGVI